MGSKHRRQAANAMVYNITQSFSATSGVQYTISARAEAISNGGLDSDCIVQICSMDNCGPQSSLSTSYRLYSYSFIARSSSSSAAILSFSCTGPAYVGVDNVMAVASSQSSRPATITTTVYPGNVSLASQPPRIITVTASLNEVTETTPTQTVTETLYRSSSYAVYQNITNDEFVTNTVYSTALKTTTAPGSNIIVTETGRSKKMRAPDDASSH